jgi:DNA-binding MarR family transcriptional regulator
LFILILKLVFIRASYVELTKADRDLNPGHENNRVQQTGCAMNTMMKTEAVTQLNDAQAKVKPFYLEALNLVERLHRRLLDVIKDEFDRQGRDDVNSVQALLLYNIGDKELTASELRTRGYYLGSNVSYNVKKLVELGYLHHARSRIDRRSVRISLTEKGEAVHAIVKGVYDKHIRTVEQLGGVGGDDFERMNNALLRLERFWTDQIRFRL